MKSRFRYTLFTRCLGCVFTVSLVLSNSTLAQPSFSPPKPGFNGKGELMQPTGYREWIYVGTPLTPNDLNPPEAPFPEFHNVYIHPDDWAHYKATGLFQDGTVIIKELVSVGSNQAVSGKGYFMGEFSGLEATVKDSIRFADEPGNWAYFSYGHSLPLAESSAAFPTAACNTCHEVSAKDDFVFTQYYPVLRAARPEVSEPMTSSNEKFQDLAATMSAATQTVFDATAATPNIRSAIPTSPGALATFLESGDYKNWPNQESKAHPSRGPHTKLGLPVRVYIDEKLQDSLLAGSGEHPIGSSIVKEMFDASGVLNGWAVMVKTAKDSEGGRGWFWHEVVGSADSKPVASGNGVPLCSGCHGLGNDYVLTAHPLQ